MSIFADNHFLFFMNMIRDICLIFSFVCIGCLQIGAKEYEHYVQGCIVDNMTGMGLDSTRVTLMGSDSTVIATSMTIPKIYGPHVGKYQFQIQKVGKYIIKAEREGYNDGYMDLELRSNRETFISVKTIRMARVSLLHVMNEQGRTESWHNGIPRYFLFSIAWRFHKAPRQN